MIASEYDDVDEFIDIALNSIFPSTEEIEPQILKEITNFLEDSETRVPLEDAEIVRGEVRKALIHFKNRPYLYNMRRKMETLLRGDDNWKRFIIAPASFLVELRKAGLNNEEIDLLQNSFKSAEQSYSRFKTIPAPKSH
ncbi:MAG: hypothetical protein ACTSVO_02370 [Candidatus Heimdallarchaeaceae archaeon]